MKPSRRRDSLEKAAMAFSHSYLNHLRPRGFDKDREYLARRVLNFAQRHGAKVRRETLKEAAKRLYDCGCGGGESQEDFTTCLETNRKAILTPRGPEKGRRG